jgi:phosphate transport system substrate-binding protein
MMNKTILLAGLIALAGCGAPPADKAASPDKSPAQQGGAISISGAFALYPLAVKWAEEFKKTHPNAKIDISAGGAGKGITDVLGGITNIGLVSRNLTPEEIQKGAVPVAVTRDAVVPTVSASNPLLKQIQARGIKKEEFNNIFITGQTKTWSQLGLNSNAPIHVYTRSDAAGAAETWAGFFGKKQDDIQGVAVFGDPGQAQAVKKDPAGIGFNNIVFVYDAASKQPSNGVVPVPIDLNGNGRIDPDEDFYGSIDQIVHAIALGKYPSPPARDLYFVTKDTVTNPLAKTFINWVLTEGQKYVAAAGYINLPQERLNEGLNKIK